MKYDEKELARMEEMLKDCARMQTFLEDNSAGRDANRLEDRLLDINTWLAYAGGQWVRAKEIHSRCKARAIIENRDLAKELAPSTFNEFINSSLYEIKYIVEWYERINRELVHQADNIRTVVSLEKEHLRLTKCGY